MCAGTDDLARADTLLAVADEIGLPAAQVAVAWLLERGRQSTTALVPVIGPRTVEQVDSYIASLDVRMDEEQYSRLDQVSRIPMGAPFEQLASQPTAPLGGDAAVFAPPRIPRG